MINTEHVELKILYCKLFPQFLPQFFETVNCKDFEEELTVDLTPVEFMGFSTRTKNTLKRYAIDNYGELKSLTQKDLERFKGLGEKGIKEIREFFEGENK